jgi:ABC-type nitrate/sulfonate/bicarbonate transport system substrate-binding protein
MRTPFAGIGVSDTKLRSNPSQVKRMIRATFRGMDYTKEPGNLERVIAYMMEEFKLDRRTAELSYREIIKAFTKDGTSPDDAVRAEVEFLRTQTKIKGQVPIGQLVDYTLLKEVLADVKR